MAITKPAKVPQAKISSLDVVSFNGGLDQRGDFNLTKNSFSVGRNVMVNKQGLATHRFGLFKWLPDTVDEGYDILPVVYEGEEYLITADDGKIKYCQQGDTEWTNATGDAVTTDGVVNTLLRVQDKVLILNGEDELGFLDLATFEVDHYDAVTDPSNAPTGAATGISGSGQNVYYAITFNSTVGETATSPILTQSVTKIRDMWKDDGSEYVTITRNNTAPTGAVSWNLYMANAPAGGSIVTSDLLPLVMGLDINTTTFVDDGSLAVNLSAGTAPEDNSTLGPKAKYGIEANGRPILYGIADDPYALRIGGDGEHALDFSPTNGGFRLLLNQGTNFYPSNVIGFRNGQGVPSLTVLFSNTEGLSKQSIVEQQTVEYGTFSFVVWGSTEQNYGAAGVSSPYGVVNYKGMLIFPSSDGIVKMDTKASLQNVLQTDRISDPIINEVGTIKQERIGQIVSTAWDNRVFIAAPTRGFNTNNKILIYDVNNPDLAIWYVWDVPAQWVGVSSLAGKPAFVYVRQGTSIYRMSDTFVARDESSSGVTTPFPVELITGVLGGNTAHNSFYAMVQAVFYLTGFIGTAEVFVKWRDENGNWQEQVDTIQNGSYENTSSGNWSDSQYLYNQHLPTTVLTFADVAMLSTDQLSEKTDVRYRMPFNAVTNEVQAGVRMNLDNSAFIARSISFEGQNLGVLPDVR